MYQKVHTQQLRGQRFKTNNMESKELILVIMFCLNSWIYLHFDQRIKVAYALQSCIDLVCMGFVVYYGISSSSVPYILCIFFTGVLLILSSDYNVESYLMLIPLLFLLSVQKIRKKLLLNGQVLLQSIGMFLSIMFCFCFFGFISFRLFRQNQEYFSTPAHSTLTYLQVATLDQIGKIVLINLQKYGFVKSFFTMVSVLIILHTLFNINQALIMQYIYSRRHNNQVTFSSTNSFRGNTRLSLKILRILNIITTSLLFIFPFQEGATQGFLITMTLLSTCFIMIDNYLEDSLWKFTNIINLILQLAILVLFILEEHQLLYVASISRIFLLSQVVNLWVKIWNVIKQVSQLFALTTMFFLIFSLISYTLQKSSEQRTKLQVVLVQSLQFITLDDWTSHIRNTHWYMSTLIIIYIILLNHIFLNALISQAFGQLKMQKEQEQPQDSNFKFIQTHTIQQQVNDKKSSKDFLAIASMLGYTNYLHQQQTSIISYQETYNDLHQGQETEVEVRDLVTLKQSN